MDQLLDLEVVATIGQMRGEDDDRFLNELVAMFGTQAVLSTERLGAALTADDATQARYFAHRLKGSAANIGARRLSDSAGAIERILDREGLNQAAIAPHFAKLAQLRVESLEALHSAWQLVSPNPLAPPPEMGHRVGPLGV